MKDFITNNGGIIATLGLMVMCLNIGLTALKTILEKVAAGSSELSLVTKACNVLSMIIDWLTANKEHKDDPPKSTP